MLALTFNYLTKKAFQSKNLVYNLGICNCKHNLINLCYYFICYNSFCSIIVQTVNMSLVVWYLRYRSLPQTFGQPF